MSEFVSDDLNDYITKLMRTVLPNLNSNEFTQLMAILKDLINFVAIRFNFDLSNPGIYIHQFKQNNNRDIYAMLNMLLPYIDDADNFQLHKLIYNISDISIKKREDVLLNGFIEKSMDTSKEINITKNPYVITNIQYNRNIRNMTDIVKDAFNPNPINFESLKTIYEEIKKTQEIDLNTISNKHFLEYKLTINDILNNFYLLLNTIDQISNKLYINWLNVRPITSNYKDSSLYKKSFKYKDGMIMVEIDGQKVEFDWYNPIIAKDKFSIDGLLREDIMRKYQGLSCGDVYNMIHHELYYGIKSFKWLIYEIPLAEQDENLYTYWDYIRTKFINMEELIGQNVEYENIEYESPDMIEKWDGIKYRIQMDITKSGTVRDIVRNIIYYVQRKFDKKSLEETKFKELKMDNKTEEEVFELLDLDNEDGIKISVRNIEESWESLKTKILYNYLRETITQFKKTWYGSEIIKKGLNTPLFGKDLIINGENKDDKISFKNVYNWAKNILLKTLNVNGTENMEGYREYNWHSLGTVSDVDINKQITTDFLKTNLMYSKITFIEAIRTRKENNDWFRIPNILNNKYNNRLDGRRIKEINDNIYEGIRSNIIDICFECMFIRGQLNEIIFDKECTDDAILTKNYNMKKVRRRAAIKNIFTYERVEEYKKCVYFLTNETYDELPLIIEEREKPKTYLEFTEEQIGGNGWATFYAMDWLSQVNFFHRYINNRVIYITGGTGAGKSSQIPKLLLYGKKMIDNNNRGKVVSTQPRVGPTKSNAEEMANAMGVPINEYSTRAEKNLQTFNNYIQYKTMDDYFVAKNVEYYFKEMTDGTLLMDLYKNPILKKPKMQNDDIFTDANEFSKDNLYDIVIIDESHEHNKNMDYILTLMKYATFWNNSLKLVIISATMTEDEPIYRRYYRDINDNMMFPLSLHNPNNVYVGTDNLQYSLDRCTVDRRMHISPPGETTQHKVLDIYLEKDTNDYMEAEAEGIKQVMKLVEMKVEGDILFFSIGKDYINSIVETLNRQLPENIIAIPFYTELPEKWKILGEKTEKIINFTTNRLDIFKEINRGDFRVVPKGTYNQVIVVATNIAEASITILKLRHIIDTGYQNSVVYDRLSRETKTNIVPISEMSRIQRRGRVGRVADGTVYYMYKEKSRSEIKVLFSICINSDVKMDIFKMMRLNHDEPLYINPLYNIYNMRNIINRNNLHRLYKLEGLKMDNVINITKNIINAEETYINFGDTKFMPEKYDKNLWENLNEILIYHYTLGTYNNALNNMEFYNMVYIGDNKLSENMEMLSNYLNRTHDRFITGYNITSLVDIYGTFHMIHPSEDLAYRHIMTGIIDINENNKHTKLDYNYILKSFSNINELYYMKMIKPSIVNKKIDLTLQSKSKSDFLNIYTNKIGYLKGIYKEMIGKSLIYINYDSQYTVDDTNDYFSKTIYADRMTKLYEELDVSDMGEKDNNLKVGCIGALICGSALNIHKEICKTIAAILAFGSQIELLVPREPIPNTTYTRFNFDKSALNQFRNTKGDLITFFNIFDKLQKDVNLNIWEPLDEFAENILKTIYEDDKKMFIKIKRDIIEKTKNNKSREIPFNLVKYENVEKFIKIQKIDQTGDLNTSKGFNKYKEFQTNKLRRNDITEEDYKRIILWAVNRGLPPENIKKMIDINKSLMNKYKSNKDNFKWFIDNKVINVKKEGTLEDNIIKSFFFGQPNNITYYYQPERTLYSLIYHIKDVNKNITIKKLVPKQNITETTLTPFKYVLYLTKDKRGNVLNLNNIEFEWIKEIIPDITNKESIPLDYKKTKIVEFYNDVLRL